MEIWLIYALLSVLFTGFYNFALRVGVERNYSTAYSQTYTYFFATIFSGIYFFYINTESISNILPILIFAFGNALFFYFSIVSRNASFKNIDSVIFYPLYKTLSPILVTVVSFFYFKEVLLLKDIIGIILGICVPLLLITSHEKTIQKNLKKGLIFVVFTSISATIASGFLKSGVEAEVNISFFIFMNLFLGFIFAFIGHNSYFGRKKKSYNSKGILYFGTLVGFIQFLNLFTFTKAIEGNLAIVFTINSFSILIPIILSIIFYKDHFNLKKAFVIILSIISVLFFL